MFPSRCLLVILIFSHPILKNGNCDSEFEIFSTSENSTKHVNQNGQTTEIYYTTCKITTEKLSADAEAKFTRVLTGPYNTKTIEERLEKLEHVLNEQLIEIRGLIIGSKTEHFDRNENEILEKKNSESENFIDQNYENDNKMMNFFRRDEINRYNNTAHEEDGQEIYNYYWRIKNLSEKLLTWETSRSERSPSFYVSAAGYAMYLKFTPKYFPDGTIFISAGLTSGKNDSKIVWPFPLQIRIEILDLGTSTIKYEKIKDRSSRLWDPATVCSFFFWGRPRQMIPGKSFDNPECVGLSVPRQLLTSSRYEKSTYQDSSTGNYLRDDSILVKLTVYL